MIKIVITKTDSIPYKETKTFLVKEVPTGIKRNADYGNREEFATEKQYEIREVDMVRTKEINLLSQEIPDENEFDLVAVIRAINGILEPRAFKETL